MNYDIEFDRYGDISFSGDSISILHSKIDYMHQSVIDRVFTNHGDYYLNPTYGANLSQLIGARVDAILENRIQTRVRASLADDPILTEHELAMATVQMQAAVYLKLEVGGGNLSISETLNIDSIFNTSSGINYVTN